MKRLHDPELLTWLDERMPEGRILTGFNHWAGFDAIGWEASVWVLNAMYETEEFPGGISHDDVRRIERAAGAVEPDAIDEMHLEGLLSRAVLTGSWFVYSDWDYGATKVSGTRDLINRLTEDGELEAVSLPF